MHEDNRPAPNIYQEVSDTLLVLMNSRLKTTLTNYDPAPAHQLLQAEIAKVVTDNTNDAYYALRQILFDEGRPEFLSALATHLKSTITHHLTPKCAPRSS